MRKVAVRRVNEWDGPAMLKIYAPFAGTACAPEREPPELQDYIARIDRYTYGLGWLICEIDSIPVGFCHLTEDKSDPQNLFSVEFQIYVKPEFQRKGVGRALWALMQDILELGSRRWVTARVKAENQPAVSFLRAMGFVQEQQGEEIVLRYALSPAEPDAERPTKPYLIENVDYEAARERAAALVHIEEKNA